MNSHRQRQSAFSLIEILISLSILIIILGGVSSLAVSTIRISKISKQESEGYAYAQEQLEQIKQIRNTNLIDGDNNTKWSTDLVQSGSIVRDGQGFKISGVRNKISPATNTEYTCRVVITDQTRDDDLAPGEKILRAVSIVEWQERGRNREVRLITYLTDWLWGYEN